MKIPALTLWQPWATFVMMGFKRWETRTHKRYSSLLFKDKTAIHAAARKITEFEWSKIKGWLILRGRFDVLKYCGRKTADYPLGVVLGTVKVSEIFKMRNTELDEYRALIEYSPRRYCYAVRDVKRFAEPIPAKGKQGIWTFEYDQP